MGRRPGPGRARRWAAGLGRPALKAGPAVSVPVSPAHGQSARSVEGDQFHDYITGTLERVTLDRHTRSLGTLPPVVTPAHLSLSVPVSQRVASVPVVGPGDRLIECAG